MKKSANKKDTCCPWKVKQVPSYTKTRGFDKSIVYQIFRVCKKERRIFMKYDLSKLYWDYIQEDESTAFRDEFWANPVNAEIQKQMEPIFKNRDISDVVSNYEACAEEFGFLTGFQLAVNLLSGGLGARAPKVEVQA
jgi:hypothetical protein